MINETKESRNEKQREAKIGNDLFVEIIDRKNKNNDYYYYECLATTYEYSPYDMQVQKHCNDDWGDIEISYHEIKVRSDEYSYKDYQDSFIDLYKIHQLQKIAYQTGKQVFVNMIYPKDRTMLIWRIEPDINYKSKYVTDVDWKSQSIAYNKEIKIPYKNFALLPNEEATKIRY